DMLRLADDYPAAPGITPGGIYEYMGADAQVDLGATNYADLNLWKPLNSTNVVPQPIVTAALKAFKLDAGTSAAYYAVIARNDVRGDAEAFIHGTTLTAAADITL